MCYNIWLPPHMPAESERDSRYHYLPLTYKRDKRLTYLDKSLYWCLLGLEQLGRSYDIRTLIKEIGSHPDRDDEKIKNYIKRSGKDIDVLSDKEFNALPTVPLNEQDVIESLKKLEKLGYIKKLDD